MTAVAEAAKQGREPAKPREWSPKLWLGCDFVPWLRLLARNGFDVDWRFVPSVTATTFISPVHSYLRWLQSALFSRAIARTPIREQPVFILGHWRSGTTWLHELLVLDPRHTSPTTYECLVPNHCIVSEWFVTRWLSFLVPSKRPMDNMAMGWDRPQEDEFALVNLGVPSPYLTIAFPNRGASHSEYLDMEGISRADLVRWQAALMRFLKEISYKRPKRLVLKSPTHTGRIKALLEMFPEARFVHIVRDPYVIFPSTVKLWKSLYSQHGLQHATSDGLEEYVFDNFNRMYRKFEAERGLIDPSRFHELRYEDLVRDPVGQVRAIYEQLDLGDFEQARPALEAYQAGVADYQTNRYEISPELEDKVTARWGDFIRKYRYERHAAQGSPVSASNR
jgi:omega-hydroxy-beta-dihydromenaquinone-9 sulfotransferase